MMHQHCHCHLTTAPKITSKEPSLFLPYSKRMVAVGLIVEMMWLAPSKVR